MDHEIHHALPLRPRKRDSYEVPPDDPIALEFEKPLLRRTTTINSFLSTSARADAFPARVYDEPQPLYGTEASTIRDIDRIAQKDKYKVPKIFDISRSTTGFSSPRRNLSLSSENELPIILKGLAFGYHSTWSDSDIDAKPEYGHHPGGHAWPRGTGPSQASGGRPGPSREHSGRAERSGNARGERRSRNASTSSASILNRTQSGRIAKNTTISAVGDEDKAEPKKPLGCPMVKGRRNHYLKVIGPCTDPKGITPSAKALNEHLKKQHSRKFRCMTCFKWHKNQKDYDEHTRVRDDIWRCEMCCKEFKKEKEDEYRKHCRDESCSLDITTKPELFSEEQEEAFNKNRNKSANFGNNLETKYRRIFGTLWPRSEEKDTVWPYYDFMSVTHLLPCSLTPEQRERCSGGIRRVPSPEPSQSDEGTEPSPQSQGMLFSPVDLQRPFVAHPSLADWSFRTGPSLMTSPMSGYPPSATDPSMIASTYSPTILTPMTPQQPRTVPSDPPQQTRAHFLQRLQSQGQVSASLSTDLDVPSMTMGTQSIPPDAPGTPFDPNTTASPFAPRPMTRRQNSTTVFNPNVAPFVPRTPIVHIPQDTNFPTVAQPTLEPLPQPYLQHVPSWPAGKFDVNEFQSMFNPDLVADDMPLPQQEWAGHYFLSGGDGAHVPLDPVTTMAAATDAQAQYLTSPHGPINNDHDAGDAQG